jgi:Protein of unknown function (DUF1566)
MRFSHFIFSFFGFLTSIFLLSFDAQATTSQVKFTPMPTGATIEGAYGFQDPKTCLIWGRNPNGLGVATKYYFLSSTVGTNTFDGAYVQVKNLKLGGFSDWRLPTIDELKALFADSTGAVPPSWWSTLEFGVVPAGQYWSSTLGGNFDATKSYFGLVTVLDYVGNVHSEANGSGVRYTWPVRYETCPAAVASPFGGLK